ncbi:TetR/AcrR family transcriptional regulator [Bacillus thermocopriae]|uniref:TetR/AcrR family transcriptional regulator n=1 Tax=Neobacillus thermocopriae TaxID=1215031 RepID=A0A6B3TLJ3_9BACI|nr:TetR/AcrR family transcriptional regulator [Neobacillus thermocopriae]NEX77804.1 TetR/AcrR family transcriptional regulator [Neobacillus thermocopriae]
MRNKNTDLRVIRTKEAIRNALVELIEEKGLDALTVKEITTKAKINRGTFYVYYQDKYDLVNKCEDEFFQELADMIIENFSKTMNEKKTNPSVTIPVTLVVSIFEHIDRNRKFMKAILGPKGDLSFHTKMKEFMWKTLFENNKFIQQENLLVPIEYLISYISSAHLGVIQQWLNSDKNESPQEMAHILYTMTANGPFYAAGLKR